MPTSPEDMCLFLETAAKGAAELNVQMPDNALDCFRVYYTFLSKRADEFNLTSISGAKEAAQMHFIDSIAPAAFSSFKSSRVIDIGSGAGFPGLPLKIIEPTIELTLLEATYKKVMFLKQLCDILSIEAVCLHVRAEEAAHNHELREKYDIAVARAVARLDVLCELCLPFVRVGGVFLAMKGEKAPLEMEESYAAIDALGAEIKETVIYTIPNTNISRSLIVLKKRAITPMIYPRRFAKIMRSPIVSDE